MPDITMPKMGFDMQEGTIVKWLKKPGDEIKKGESIAEIETDKVTIEIEAFDSGTLSEIVVQEGQTAPVNSVIARLAGGDARPAGEAATAAVGAGEGGEARPEAQAAGTGGTARVTEEAPTVQSAGTVSGQMPGALPTAGNGQAPPEGDEQDVKASPLARRMARDAGVSLRQIQGSGPGGRVVREDVEAFLSGKGQAAQPAAPAQRASSPAPAPAAAPAQQAPAPAAAPAPTAAAAPAPAPGGTLTPLTSMRRTIARRTLQNWQSIPHVFVTFDVDMGAALALRKQVNEGLPKESQISVNDLVLKASALALVTYPQVNVSYTEEGIQQHQAVNLSIAVALESGLVAPVLMNAQDRSLGSIAREAKRLIGLVREGKLTQEILSGGTFQVSNLGMFGVSEFGSIISLPQAAALAVGAIQRVPMFAGDTDEVVAKHIMKITVSADHRALDGAEAAKFGAEVKRLLESPMALLVG